MRRFVLVTALGTMLVTAVDCSGDGAAATPAANDTSASEPVDAGPTPELDAGPPTPVRPGSLAALCQATYGTLFDAYDACCTAPDRTTLRYKLVFGQLGVFKEACTPQLEASAAAGRVVLDDAAFQSCTGAFASFFAGGACGKDLSPVLDMDSIAGCDAVVRGKQAAGMPCLRDYECENGLTCVGYAGQHDGTCTTRPPIGAACGAGKSDAGAAAGGDAVIAFSFGDHPLCTMGATCNRSTGRCVTRLAASQPCTDTEQCDAGLTCLLGKCSTATPAVAGGACKSNKDCQGATLFCEVASAGTTGKCAPKKPAGSACSAAGALGGSSCSGQCIAPDGGSAAQCVSFCGSG